MGTWGHVVRKGPEGVAQARPGGKVTRTSSTSPDTGGGTEDTQHSRHPCTIMRQAQGQVPHPCRDRRTTWTQEALLMPMAL